MCCKQHDVNRNVRSYTVKTIPAILQSLAFTVLVMVALCSLVEYGIRDYQTRAKERQALLDEARRLKSHPLVVNGCTTDAECKRLDAMLAAINASYE